ncbi:hypothetical protein Goshw_028223, partial [Gossypium schwendimanii]|nr:hypothetical protein [Gossypium schwendimanii]
MFVQRIKLHRERSHPPHPRPWKTKLCLWSRMKGVMSFALWF